VEPAGGAGGRSSEDRVPDRRNGWRRATALIGVLGVVFVSSATAKEFGRGDLPVCGAGGCATIRSASAVRAFSVFAFGGGRPRVVPTPRVGSASFAIRFRDGSLIGVAATTSTASGATASIAAASTAASGTDSQPA
jgi:hypothetical protein